MKKIEVTKENVGLYEKANDELLDRIEDLVAMTRKYPVECVFGDVRRVFASRIDIVDLIFSLQDGIRSYKELTAEPTGMPYSWIQILTSQSSR